MTAARWRVSLLSAVWMALSTAAGAASPEASPSQDYWLFGGVFLAVLMLGGAWILVRRRRRSQRAPSVYPPPAPVAPVSPRTQPMSRAGSRLPSGPPSGRLGDSPTVRPPGGPASGRLGDPATGRPAYGPPSGRLGDSPTVRPAHLDTPTGRPSAAPASGSPAPPRAEQHRNPTPAPREALRAPTPAPAAADLWLALDWLPGSHIRTEGGRSLTLGSLLGTGAAGAVFEAAASGSAEKFAVKVLLEDRWHETEFRQRLIREMRLCSKLTHANVVSTYDWGLITAPDGVTVRPFLLMEKLVGRTLRQLMDGYKKRPLPVQHMLSWSIELLRALHAAHTEEIIHRDVKPENIMILEVGHVKLMDFGVARDMGKPGLTRTNNTPIGTPLYMSPEHFNSRAVGPESDVYSCGVVMYEMLAGHPPYEAADVWSLVGRIMVGDAPPVASLNPQVPPALSDLIAKMMAGHRAERIPSADVALQALTDIARQVAPQLAVLKPSPGTT